MLARMCDGSWSPVTISLIIVGYNDTMLRIGGRSKRIPILGQVQSSEIRQPEVTADSPIDYRVEREPIGAEYP